MDGGRAVDGYLPGGTGERRAHRSGFGCGGHDLENASMSITEAEKKIKAFADGHRSDGFGCVLPGEADAILREFYGLPFPSGSTEWGGGLGLDLADFWG